ncbi:TPA: lysozyme [Yersinia enterocolitica]|uniref:lysozyme n=1 Tax=Yersinia enterocolitica TaxID=630 RepID=UPI0005E498C2|nr:lysozyme [Yersinia enterocolitica]AOF18411.1 lysozyme [Yersinia enterocolitica]AOF22942.1 lysozyme [Yersinia enterocolitica]AOF26652.1 lysozyme [Yersinia enterocolitica]AOF30765.1 lysozyme [Yersinia enterocolitica]AOF34685.1 lysozyme [Yersinia enterocolitica]
MPNLKISQRGIALIKQFEGCKLSTYPDPATGSTPWTIGFGHTKGVKPGDVITAAQAEQYLLDDLAPIYITIENAVKVPLNQNQFDALCSFIFNLGAGNFVKSTLLKKLNAGDYRGAADEFSKWVNGNGKPMPGLIRRRATERELFLA